jgi:hypothetical protein
LKLVQTLLGGLASISALPLRVGAAKARLREDPRRSARELEGLVGAACRGHVGARKAMLACAIALVQEDDEEWVADLSREATAQELPITSGILQRVEAHFAVRRLPDPHVPGSLLASFLDARHQGTMGRSYLLTCHLMEQLLLHPDAQVVRRLLAARALLPRDAVIVAARRPTSTLIVREVLASIRWVGRLEVREALVSNPFVATHIALKLLPTVSTSARRGLARGGVHPMLQRVAASLAGLGSPIRILA